MTNINTVTDTHGGAERHPEHGLTSLELLRARGEISANNTTRGIMLDEILKKACGDPYVALDNLIKTY